MNLSLRVKLFSIIAFTLLVLLTTQTYLQVQLQQQAFDNELKQRTILMQQNLQQRAISQAETLKHLIAEYIAAYKLFELFNTTKQAAMETHDLEKIIVLDKLNQVYVDTSKPDYSGFYIPEEGFLPTPIAPQDTQSKVSNNFNDYILREVNLGHTKGLEFKTPIKNEFYFSSEINLDLNTDGRRNVLIRTSPVSIDPHWGIEIGYGKWAAVRFGLGNFTWIKNPDQTENLTLQPNIGLGVGFKSIKIFCGYGELCVNTFIGHINSTKNL